MPSKPKKIMRAFKINEISGVDVPAQEGAIAVIMKRSDETDLPIDDKKKKKIKDGVEDISKLSALTDGTNGHSHTIALLGPPDGVQLVAGDTSYADGHTHPWVMMGGGEIRIGAAKDSAGLGHFHAVEAMSKNENTGDAGFIVGKTEEPIMPGKKTEPTIAELQVQLAKSLKMASLNDAEKSYHKDLGEEAGTAFLDMSSEDRGKMVKTAADVAKAKALDDNPVIYTTTAGVELRKSVGADFIALAQNNDILMKRLDKSDEVVAKNDLEKRATELLPNLPGTIEERAAVLKAVDGIEDKDHRAAAMANLASQNTALGKSLTTFGYQGGNGAILPEAGGEAGDLDKLAKKYQADNAGVTYEKAYSKVLETPAGAAAYAKTVN